jgi:ankyrin repeat protein
MKHTIKIYIFSLFTFFSLYSMDSTNSTILSDQDLQCIIPHINTFHLNVINLIKKSAENENTPLTAKGLSSLLQLSQEEINDSFLNSISSNSSIFNVMLAMGADINAQNKKNENCLFYTSNPEILSTLIAQKANVHCRNASNETPLIHHCYYILKPKLLDIFLAAGADPDSVRSPEAHTLLSRAIETENIESVRLLCHYKTNVNHDPRQYSVQNPDDRNLLSKIIDSENFESVGLPRHYKTNVNHDPRQYFKNPLMLTLTYGNKRLTYEIVEILLKSGAIADCHDNFKDNNEYYRYALHHVTGWPELSSFNEKLILLLLEYKADPNRPYPFTEGKDYPLHQAVTLKHLVVITALLKHGARTDYRNQKGFTPLGLAKSLNCPHDIITLLSQYTIITPEPDNMTIIPIQNASKNDPCVIL